MAISEFRTAFLPSNLVPCCRVRCPVLSCPVVLCLVPSGAEPRWAAHDLRSVFPMRLESNRYAGRPIYFRGALRPIRSLLSPCPNYPNCPNRHRAASPSRDTKPIPTRPHRTEPARATHQRDRPAERPDGAEDCRHGHTPRIARRNIQPRPYRAHDLASLPTFVKENRTVAILRAGGFRGAAARFSCPCDEWPILPR
jgi:hypothetical protein